MAGFVLARQQPIGKWGNTTYALQKTARTETTGGIGVIGSSHKSSSTSMAQMTMKLKDPTVR